MTDLERAIVATVARMKADGLVPKTIYVTPDDFAELARLGHAETIGGLAVKRCAGRNGSKIYDRRGVSRSVTLKPLGWRLAARKSSRIAVRDRLHPESRKARP